MGLRLSVQRAAWLRAIEVAATDRPGLIPVVKGNGYGFGRSTLMPIAAGLNATTSNQPTSNQNGQIAVGTVYEAADVPPNRIALVLTPHIDALPASLPTSAILTVGHPDHARALERSGWTGRVSIKLASTMRRYGTSPEALPDLLAAASAAGFITTAYALHLPVAGTEDSRCAEIEAWMPMLDPSLPLSVSHVEPATYARLCTAHPERTLHIRSGTALWHADKTLLHLTADVIEVHAVAAGTVAGYHESTVPADGHLVLVAAGSAHGLRAHDDGRSPFHFARQRVLLLERPHMHTSMLFVPNGQPLPSVGDRIDVQRPLIETAVDETEWLDG
jgi:alanine racemase